MNTQQLLGFMWHTAKALKETHQVGPGSWAGLTTPLPPNKNESRRKKAAFSLMQPPRDSLLEDLTRGGIGFPLDILLSLSSSWEPRARKQVSTRIQVLLIQAVVSSASVCLGLRASRNMGLSVLIGKVPGEPGGAGHYCSAHYKRTFSVLGPRLGTKDIE